MDDMQTRLKRCFAAVFPGLDDAAIEKASISTVSNWDSIAGVTLMAVIEEEFCVALPVDRIGDFTSFELLRDYLASPREATIE